MEKNNFNFTYSAYKIIDQNDQFIGSRNNPQKLIFHLKN